MKKFFNKSLNTVFDNMNIEYDDMLTLMKDTAHNELHDVTKTEAEDKIREMMFSVLELDPEQVNNKKMFRRAMQKNKTRFFEVIEDVVEDMLVQGWDENPFFMDFVEMKNLADGDTNEFYTEDDTILAVAKVSGNHHDIILQQLGEGETYSVKTSTYGVAIGTDLRLFLSGRKDWTELVSAVYRAYDKKVKDTMYNEVINVGKKLPSSDMFNKAIQLNAGTKAQVDELIENVSAANNNCEVVIMGTQSAVRKLSALTDVNWVSEGMKEEKNTTGRVGYYEGTRLIEIPQRLVRKNGKVERMIASDILLVLPMGVDKFVKFVNVGDPEIVEITEAGARMDDSMKFEYQQSFGIGTVIGKQIGAIKINA